MATTFDLFNPTEEHQLLRGAINAFVKAEVEPQALAHNRSEEFNLPLFRKLGSLGILGITASTEFGGAEADAVSAVIVHEELSASDPAFCLSELLPRLVTGEYIGAMAMSEAEAGTDVLSMRTTASNQGDHYILNGQKMWITNGCIDNDGKVPGDVVIVYARTNDPCADKPKISTFIVTKDTPGFSVGQKIRDKSGMRASNTAELVFDNCKIPSSNLIGNEGESITHMMRNLEIERVTLAAMSLGIARRSLEVMIDYAKTRKSFGKYLYEFGQIQRHIAESFAEYQAARAYVYNTARMLTLDKAGQRLDSDGVKLFATPVGKQIADRAMQVLGGNGYIGEYVVERLWRDAKLLEIGGGTLEAHQKNITFDLVRS